MEVLSLKINFDRDDRFFQGMISGMIAGIFSETLSFISGALNISMMRYVDYAGVLLLGNIPLSTIELIISTGFATFFAAMLGIIFAYIVPIIGSTNLYLKGWLYGLFTWYIWYSILVMTLTDKLEGITPATAVSNFIVASMYGLLLGIIYNKLYESA
jgi:hypothetical protein